MLIQKFVHRMKGSKREIVSGQILGLYVTVLTFVFFDVCCKLLFKILPMVWKKQTQRRAIPEQG